MNDDPISCIYLYILQRLIRAAILFIVLLFYFKIHTGGALV